MIGAQCSRAGHNAVMTSPAPPPAITAARVLTETRAWVDQAVIALNLCPFAKAVQVKGLVRYVVSEADTAEALAVQLADELRRLAATPIGEVETTLLVHPWVLDDFLDFNHFLGLAEDVLAELGLDGEIQIASFHPDYRFAGTRANDITNASNRSPWPTLHLIREASMDRAVEAGADADSIVEANLATLRRLGTRGWAELRQRWQAVDTPDDGSA